MNRRAMMAAMLACVLVAGCAGRHVRTGTASPLPEASSVDKTVLQSVSFGGAVRGPGPVAYRADLTVIGAINTCGGFTEAADQKAVRIVRGKQVICIDAFEAISDLGRDPAVMPGDKIFVPNAQP